MSHPKPAREVLKAATDMLVAYALVSLEEPYLLWEKSVNLGMAEFIWNAYPGEVQPTLSAGIGEPSLGDLIQRLTEARREQRDADFMVFGLDVRHEVGDMLFTFDLTWDEGASFQACEIAVAIRPERPGALN